jgi:hypothetical protein
MPCKARPIKHPTLHVYSKAQGRSRLYQNKGLRRAQLGMMQVKAAAKCIDLFQIFIT